MLTAFPRARVLSLLAALALAVPRLADARPLRREWCTGTSPASWGFGITPPGAVREVRLRLRSAGIKLTAARGGPSLPPGWSVALASGSDAVASGPEALVAGTTLPAFFIVETSRPTGDVTARGVLPVTWDLVFAAEPGGKPGAPLSESFPPVLRLDDAVQRGLVLCTLEPLSAVGPVEVTVDNPTWQPLLLDLPPGTLVKGGGDDWVVGLVPPFDMMRRQKTGRTLSIFPLTPPASPRPPRRLTLAGATHDKSRDIAALALAVQRLRDERGPAGSGGAFASSQPFDFWPIVLEWGIWKEMASPARGVLVDLIASLLGQRKAAGDRLAGEIDPAAAASEVESTLAEVQALREKLGAEPLPLEALCEQARFR